MKTLTKEQLAQQLNGNTYGAEITTEQEQLAKENNLLVLFGASDDLLKARGVIHDEYEAWNGGEFLLIKIGEKYQDDEDDNTYHEACEHGLFTASDDCDTDNHPRLIAAEAGRQLEVGLTATLSIWSNMSSASFTITEAGAPYCEGIVIDLDEVEPIS